MFVRNCTESCLYRVRSFSVIPEHFECSNQAATQKAKLHPKESIGRWMHSNDKTMERSSTAYFLFYSLAVNIFQGIKIFIYNRSVRQRCFYQTLRTPLK